MLKDIRYIRDLLENDIALAMEPVFKETNLLKELAEKTIALDTSLLRFYDQLEYMLLNSQNEQLKANIGNYTKLAANYYVNDMISKQRKTRKNSKRSPIRSCIRTAASARNSTRRNAVVDKEVQTLLKLVTKEANSAVRAIQNAKSTIATKQILGFNKKERANTKKRLDTLIRTFKNTPAILKRIESNSYLDPVCAVNERKAFYQAYAGIIADSKKFMDFIKRMVA